VRVEGSWLTEGLYAAVVLVLWVHFYLTVARYATFGDPVVLTLALLSVALQFTLSMIFVFTMGFAIALRGLVIGTGIALLLATLSAGWGVAYVRPADPRELLVRQPTAAEVRDLVQTLRDLSWRETGIPTTLPLTLEAAPDSVLAWYLRDFSTARRVESLDAGEIGPRVVTSRRDLTLPGTLDDVEYAGQDFALRRSWDPRVVGCTWEWPPRCDVAVRWLLFRHTPAPAVLWLRQEPGGISSHSH
jgi:hypothetical protein